MENSDMAGIAIKIAEDPHLKWMAAAAGALAIAAILVFVVLPVDASCKSAPCFLQALKECSQKTFQINDNIPSEGNFAHSYRIEGAQKLSQKESVCRISWRLNQTGENGISTVTSGECRLLNYKTIDLQFEWMDIFDRQAIGECLRLERKLNGIGA